MSSYDEPAKLHSFGRDEAEDALEIGRRLAFFRKELGLSQPQVARALNMHQSKIAKLELGQQRLMMRDAMAFSMIYRVDLGLLDPRTPFDERRAHRRLSRD